MDCVFRSRPVRLGMLAVAVVATMAANPALARETSLPFEIPAQPLADALGAFARQSGKQMLFAEDVVAARQGQAVSGSMTPREALARILSGAGVRFQTDDGSVFVLQADPPGRTGPDDVAQLSPVIVTGLYRGDLLPVYAGGKVATGTRVGMLGYKDFMETPFSTISYTEEAVQQAQDLARVIGATDASVYDLGMRGTVREAFVIRGLDVGSGDIAFGGLYGLLPYNRVPLELVERVEVLKGASAMLNGMPPGGSVGGSINLVPKRANETPLTRVTGWFVSDGQYGMHVDMGRRFGDKQQLGIRFNGLHHDGRTAIDGQSKRASLGALGLDWRHERLRLSADLYANRDYVSSVNRGVTVAANAGVPAAPDPRRSLAPDWTYSRAEDAALALRAEADVNDDVTVYANIGQGRTHYDGLLGVVFAVTDAEGGYRNNVGQQRQRLDRTAADVGVMARMATGSVRHELAVSGSFYRQDIRSKTALGLLPQDWYTNIYQPTWGPAPATVIPKSDVPRTGTSRLASVGLADTMSFADDRVILTLGVRRQHVVSDAFHAVTGTRVSRYDASATTPAAALLVKMTDEVSAYANVIEGLREGAIAPVGSSNAGEIFAPYKTRQHELGIKVDLGTLAATLSAYQIRLPNSYLDAVTNVFSFDGEQRNRGVELGMFGEPWQGLRLMGGISWLDARMVRTAGAVDEGRYAMARPRWQGKLGVEWDVPGAQGLTVTGNAQSYASQYFSRNNALRTAGRTVFDAGLQYRTSVQGREVTLRADVLNVANKAYWASGGSGKLWLGAPRTFMLSARADF